jgi:Zn-finger nucleic acid-binding protein
MQMTCPKCMGQMRQYERSGITVDQCTECRGIFLDRGELERLLDAENNWHGAAGGGHQQQPPQYAQPQRHKDWDSDEYPVYRQQQGHGGHHPHKKRRGFLEELFD